MIRFRACPFVKHLRALILSLGCLFAFVNPVHSNPAVGGNDRILVRVGITTTQYAPYWVENNGRFSGLIVEKLQQIFHNSPYRLEFTSIPRNRIDQEFTQGRFELRIADPKWVGLPNAPQSVALMTLEDIYWSRNIKYLPHPAKVCAVLGFVYSDTFEQKVRSGSFIRIDATHPAQAFRMLARNRCDLTIADSRLGQHLVEKNGLTGKVKRLQWADQSWQLRIIARPTTLGEGLVNFINQQISAP